VGQFRTKTQKIRLYKSELYSHPINGFAAQIEEWKLLGDIKEIKIVPTSEGSYEITAIIEVEAEVIEEETC
jgi:hypothetical protein